MRIILTVGRKGRWKTNVMNVDLRRSHVQKLLSLRSTSRTRRPTMVCIAGSGILRIACGEEEEKDEHGKAAGT